MKLHEGLNFTVTQTVIDYPLAVYNNLLVIKDVESVAGVYKIASSTSRITIQGEQQKGLCVIGPMHQATVLYYVKGVPKFMSSY